MDRTLEEGKVEGGVVARLVICGRTNQVAAAGRNGGRKCRPLLFDAIESFAGQLW